MPKHTQDPWLITETEDRIEIYVPADPVGVKVIATVGVGFAEPWESEQRANATLLHAAPAVLSALRRFVNSSQCMCSENASAATRRSCDHCVGYDAIAQAEGRR